MALVSGCDEASTDIDPAIGGASNGTAGGGAGASSTPGGAGSGAAGGNLGSAGAAGSSSVAGHSSGASGEGGSGAGGVGGAGAGGAGAGGAGAGGAGAGGAGAGGAGAGGETGVFRPCPSDGSACKVMPFGDSITDGFGTHGAYRVELFRLAHQAGKNITFVGKQSNGPSQVDGVAFPPQHEGHSGYTIENIGGRTGIAGLVGSVVPELKPHIIALMIGTNDAIDDADLANAPARLGNLVDSIFALLPSVLIVLAQPIPSKEDALNGRIQVYNAALPALVEARAQAGRHIVLVDMYAPFAAKADYKNALLKDTWHPNEAGHVVLGAAWYTALAPHL